MENNNKTWSPIAFAEVDPRILALGTKSSEQKIYLTLYTYREDGELMRSFDISTGRIDCARAIERFILDHPSIDIHNSVILVEIPAINAKGEGEWVLKHPDKSMTVYQFANSFRMCFSDEFDIEEFNYQNEDNNEPREVTMGDIAASMKEKTVKSEADIFEGSQEMADAYRQAMEGKDQ